MFKISFIYFTFFLTLKKIPDSELVKSPIITKSNKISAKMRKVNYCQMTM